MIKFITAIILLFCAFTYSLSFAEPREEIFGDWALRCSGKETGCVLRQQIFVEGTEQAPLIYIGVQALDVIKKDGRLKSLWVTLRVPLGVKLSPGLQLRIDGGEAQTIPLNHCQATGCISLLQLTDDFRKRLEAGNKASVTFHVLSGQGISVPVSLSGFTVGVKALIKRLSE